MVNKAVPDKTRDIALDVNQSGVDVVDIVPVRAEEDVVRVALTPGCQCLVRLVCQIQDGQQCRICLGQYLKIVCHGRYSYAVWLNNVDS